jgi:hypothetical protein
MPNQRKEGKKLKTLWLTVQEYDVLKKLAKQAGLSSSCYLKRSILEYIEKTNTREK